MDIEPQKQSPQRVPEFNHQTLSPFPTLTLNVRTNEQGAFNVFHGDRQIKVDDVLTLGDVTLRFVQFQPRKTFLGSKEFKPDESLATLLKIPPALEVLAINKFGASVWKEILREAGVWRFGPLGRIIDNSRLQHAAEESDPLIRAMQATRGQAEPQFSIIKTFTARVRGRSESPACLDAGECVHEWVTDGKLTKSFFRSGGQDVYKISDATFAFRLVKQVEHSLKTEIPGLGSMFHCDEKAENGRREWDHVSLSVDKILLFGGANREKVADQIMTRVYGYGAGHELPLAFRSLQEAHEYIGHSFRITPSEIRSDLLAIEAVDLPPPPFPVRPTSQEYLEDLRAAELNENGPLGTKGLLERMPELAERFPEWVTQQKLVESEENAIGSPIWCDNQGRYLFSLLPIKEQFPPALHKLFCEYGPALFEPFLSPAQMRIVAATANPEIAARVLSEQYEFTAIESEGERYRDLGVRTRGSSEAMKLCSLNYPGNYPYEADHVRNRLFFCSGFFERYADSRRPKFISPLFEILTTNADQHEKTVEYYSSVDNVKKQEQLWFATRSSHPIRESHDNWEPIGTSEEFIPLSLQDAALWDATKTLDGRAIQGLFRPRQSEIGGGTLVDQGEDHESLFFGGPIKEDCPISEVLRDGIEAFPVGGAILLRLKPGCSGTLIIATDKIDAADKETREKMPGRGLLALGVVVARSLDNKLTFSAISHPYIYRPGINHWALVREAVQ